MAWLVGPEGQVTGLDFSQAMVDVAKQRSEGSDISVSFVQADACSMPFADNTFDRCRADKTFQHLPNPRGALVEMVRVTRPTGIILIAEADRWIAAFEDDMRSGRFFHAMNYFFTVGRKR